MIGLEDVEEALRRKQDGTQIISVEKTLKVKQKIDPETKSRYYINKTLTAWLLLPVS